MVVGRFLSRRIFRPNRLKPSTIESITRDNNTPRFDSIQRRRSWMTIFSSSFFSNRGKEGTLSISPLIRSDRGKTRLGHICKTITSPDSMLEITSFRRFLDDFDYRFRTLNAFPTSMQFSSFSFPSSCGENSARRAYLRDDNTVRFNARNDVVKISG